MSKRTMTELAVAEYIRPLRPDEPRTQPVRRAPTKPAMFVFPPMPAVTPRVKRVCVEPPPETNVPAAPPQETAVEAEHDLATDVREELRLVHKELHAVRNVLKVLALVVTGKDSTADLDRMCGE